jgi:hypothetical protein
VDVAPRRDLTPEEDQQTRLPGTAPAEHNLMLVEPDALEVLGHVDVDRVAVVANAEAPAMSEASFESFGSSSLRVTEPESSVVFCVATSRRSVAMEPDLQALLRSCLC